MASEAIRFKIGSRKHRRALVSRVHDPCTLGCRLWMPKAEQRASVGIVPEALCIILTIPGFLHMLRVWLR